MKKLSIFLISLSIGRLFAQNSEAEFKAQQRLFKDQPNPKKVKEVKTDQQAGPYLHEVLDRAKAWNARIEGAGIFSSVSEVKNNAIPGRARDFLIDKQNNIYLLAASGGGLWSYNPYVSNNSPWENKGGDFSVLSTTSISQSPLNKQVVYVATGDGMSSDIAGGGIFQSTDGGKTFKALPSTKPSVNPDFNTIEVVRCSPSDENTLYSASYGKLYKSSDAGATWTKVLDQGYNSIKSIVFLASSGVMVSVNDKGLYKSTTGDANSFAQITATVPYNDNSFSGIMVASYGGNRNTVYALFSKDQPWSNPVPNDSRVYKSTDGGATWVQKGSPAVAKLAYAWSSAEIAVSPVDENYLWVGGVGDAFSTDGGLTWKESQNNSMGYDIREIIFDATDKKTVWGCHDFGVTKITLNASETDYDEVRQSFGKMFCAQLYNGDYYPTGDGFIVGAQDWGSQIASNGTSNFRYSVGDGFVCYIHKQKPNVSYGSNYSGNIFRYSNSENITQEFLYGNNTTKPVSILGEMDANKDQEPDERHQFATYFVMNEADGDQLYFPTYAAIWRSTNQGTNWQKIYTKPSNGRTDAMAITEELNPTLYIVLDNNAILSIPSAKTYAIGGTTAKVAENFLPTSQYGYITSINLEPGKTNTLIAATSKGKVVKISNANTTTPTVTSLSGDMPDITLNNVLMHPTLPNVLMAGSDIGLFTSNNGGVNWSMETTIPYTRISNIRLRKSDLRLDVYTYGRGLWRTVLSSTLTSVEDISNNLGIRANIYPNPVKSLLNIETQGLSGTFDVRIYDAKGVQRIVSQMDSPKTSIETRNLEKGLYILHLVQDQKLAKTEKVVVE